MNLTNIENQLKHAISIVQQFKPSQTMNSDLVASLRTHLIETLNQLDNLYDNNSDTDCDSDCSDTDSDASFTQEELTYIKNESHRNYLKRYSLKPKFPLHYYNANRDSK